ncbi:MAG TPA: MmcQ/YjbR family DNA-binding protein [Polyangiaceae bacterium]|nr:MmcQ/YjbR family DNA-binding protein [Polyangiaceae bacterium]
MAVKYTKPKPDIARAEAAIAKLAASYPEVTEDHPWGHSAFKVKGKTFLFLYADGDGLSVSVKLPESRKQALAHPFAEPTHYGLGKSGWVTARVSAASELPMAEVKAWLRESFLAIAPKSLAAGLSSAPSRPPKAAPPKAKRVASSAKKRPARKATRKKA